MARHLRTWFVIFVSLFLCVPVGRVYAENQESAAGPKELNDHLTGVSWEVSPEYDGTNFTPIDPNSIISILPNATYRLKIDYTLSPDDFAETSHWTYKLPDAFSLSEMLSGTIYNDGVKVGEYTIDSNGLVTLMFSDEFIKDSQTQGNIYGDFQFTIQGNQINISEEGSTNIKFNDKLEFTLTGTNNDPQPSQNDIEIKKEGEKIEGTNCASYTIVVTAKTDTTDPIVVTDSLKNGSAKYNQESLKIINSNGEIVSGEIAWGDNTFDLKLPALKKDETYTISYEMEVDKLSNNETTTLQNYAEAKSGDQTVSVWGPELTYTHTMLQKEGKLVGDEISWTITLNETKEDLQGWTLSDEYNQAEQDRTVHVEPAIDGKNEITLPYTFTQSTTQTYTITYRTNAEVMINNQQAVNKAILTKGEEKIEQETGVHIPDSADYNPISKTGEEITLVDKNTAETTWKVTIDLSHGTLEPGWTYTDTLSTGDSYYTENQKKALVQAIIEAFKIDDSSIEYTENGFTSDEIDFEWVKEDWETNVRKFQITGKKSLSKGTKISFTYKATTTMESGTVNNGGVLRDREKVKEVSAELTLKPLIEKHDPSSWESTWSIHDRKDLTEDTLYWNVVVNIPKGQTEKFVVTDTLPKEVTYEDAYVKDIENFDKKLITHTDNKITLTLDEQFVKEHQEQEIILVVAAKLNEQNIHWQKEDEKSHQVSVVNTASISQNDVEIKTVQQTQKIIESTVRNRIDKIDPKQSGKETTHSLDELKDGIIEWKISQYIEPDQKEALTIEDTFPESLTYLETKTETPELSSPKNEKGKLIWKLDEQFVKENAGKTIELLVRFQIPESFSWKVNEENIEKASGVFTNTCTVFEGEEQTDTDEQTQTIIKDRFKGSLDKKGSYDNSTGVLSYTVNINPEGTVFSKEGKTIHIHDCLKYRFKDEYDSYRVNFLPTKATLFEVSKDGTKKEIPESEWTLKYEVKVDEWDPGMQKIEIDMDVPDGKHLELNYSYQVLGQKVMDQTISNVVQLRVDDKTYTESNTSTGAKTVTHSATAGTRSLTLYKADESNVHLHLTGAQFDLYKYGSDGQYTKVNSQPIETAADGKVSLSDIEFNTAYYLIETKAPNGYLLDETEYYFYVLGESTFKKCMPENFEVDEKTHTYMNNSNVFLTNKKNTTSLSIEKQWLDQGGIALAGPTREIECSILQFKSDTPVDQTYMYSLTIERSGTKLRDDKEVKVKKGTKLKISFVTRDGKAQVKKGDVSIEPDTEEPVQGEYDWGTYNKYTYFIAIDQPHVILNVSNWNISDVEVEVIEPEQEGTVVGTVQLNKQNNYQTTVDDLITEEIIDGKTIYYWYEVEEKPVPGFTSAIEQTDNKFLIVNQKTENGGFEFPVTGTSRKQLRSYIGGVMIFGLICVCIHALNLQRKERRK